MRKRSSIRRSQKNIADITYTSEKGWETVVDFTDGGKHTGMPVEEVIKIMKKMRR